MITPESIPPADPRQSSRQFNDDLDRLVHRYRSEHDVTYAEMIGALQFKIHLLCSEAAALAEQPRERG